jgi:hypothetical protein
MLRHRAWPTSNDIRANFFDALSPVSPRLTFEFHLADSATCQIRQSNMIVPGIGLWWILIAYRKNDSRLVFA